MFAHKKIDQLRPEQNYQIQVRLNLASNAPYGCSGIGGGPGEHVFVKAGISEYQPQAYINDWGWHAINIDKGNHDEPGEQIKLIGDIANSQHCDDHDGHYEIKSLMTPQTIEFTTDEHGQAWLVVGTDAMYEAEASVYYLKALLDIRQIDGHAVR